MRLLLVSLALLACTACGTEAPPECPECEPPSPALRQIAGLSFLVSHVAFPRVESRATAGFDIDHFDSNSDDNPADTCEQRMDDYESTLHPRITGVDNIGQGLIPSGEGFFTDRTFEAELDTAVNTGIIRWAIRVGPLDEDGAPTVPLELFVIDASETIAVDAIGRPAAGQTLRGSQVASGIAEVDGSFAWGDAGSTEAIAPAVFLLPFADLRLGAMGIEAINSARLRAQIGGSFSVDALSSRLIAEAAIPETDRPEVEYIFGAVADIEPMPDAPSSCQRISVGFELEAVPVELITE